METKKQPVQGIKRSNPIEIEAAELNADFAFHAVQGRQGDREKQGGDRNYDFVTHCLTGFYYLCLRNMKFHPGILFLFFVCLVAWPTSAVQACGNCGAGEETTVGQRKEECFATVASHCVEENSPCQDCPPDTDGCGHCHCPGCGAMGVSAASFFKNAHIEVVTPSWLFVSRATNFRYCSPSSSAHLAALFQPPRF